MSNESSLVSLRNAGVTDLAGFFGPDRVELAQLATHLDSLDAMTRLRAIRTLKRKQQAMLFEAAKGFARISLADFVPPDSAPLKEIIHDGRNTLLAFNYFQKRFCKPSDPSIKDKVWGYNEQTFRFFTGPGYFVCKPHEENEVVIDYYDVPPEKPESWPKIKSNDSLFGSLVYGKMRDYMRGVSQHVTIGRANRKGKDFDAWFVLCRQS